jgi:hypothetical protein
MLDAVTHIGSVATNAPGGYEIILAQIAIVSKEKTRIQTIAKRYSTTQRRTNRKRLPFASRLAVVVVHVLAASILFF